MSTKYDPHWLRRGVVVIVSAVATGTEEHEFESRQGVHKVFRRLYLHYIAVLCNLIPIAWVCI
jgi:hypothetical protein